jgi:general nucleoside transport system permease protein
VTAPAALPRWVEIGMLPLLNVALALAAAGLLVWAIGQNPWRAVRLLLDGAFGSPLAWGYTLYYSTNFIFTGLAVAVAFHGGHFNIGAEGQATLGGLGVGLMMLALDQVLPGPLLWPLALCVALVAGFAWALIPAGLQVLAPLGIAWPATPLNLAFVLALLACGAVWLLLWHTRLGHALRAVGLAPDAARYAGHDPKRLTVIGLGISGALAGLVGVNEIAGVHHKLLLDFVAGAGFTGIAVALMGRNHPLGILLASLLFGALAQGGSELVFEMPAFTRDMAVAVQGLVVLICGALAQMPRPWVARAYAVLIRRA